MNEDTFNTSLRGFPQKSRHHLAARDRKSGARALADGRLKGHEKLPVKMVLTVGRVNLTHEITAEIELGKSGPLARSRPAARR